MLQSTSRSTAMASMYDLLKAKHPKKFEGVKGSKPAPAKAPKAKKEKTSK
jgi:hypothetical protein